jgi:hypothetical protein
MEWTSSLVELGVVGIALLAVLMLVDLIRKKMGVDSSGSHKLQIVECPNRIEGLAATLEEMSKQSGAQTKVMTALMQATEHNRSGIDRLVEQHRPEDGRETWKIPPRMERLQEETRDLLRELVTEVKRNGRT